MPRKTRPPARRPRRRRFAWAGWPDEKLLDVRLCDLGVRIEGTPLESCVQRLYAELAHRGLRFRPHCWLSEEWSAFDGVPGIAVPFYLAHPRLMRLERGQMLEVEGGTREWCMRILRHEAGHAVDAAYGLHRRRRWRELFGRFTARYPNFYRPRPYSRHYVLHLDAWYAQSHPAEDFAETFAVWLRPNSRWRAQYRGWPAMKKLRYVDGLMARLRGARRAVVSRERVHPLRSVRKTLRQHYEEKRARYRVEYPHSFDRDLKRLFADRRAAPRAPRAATLLKGMGARLRRLVARGTGEHQYTVDQVLARMAERARELDLRLPGPDGRIHHEVLVMLTVQVMNYLHAGHHRVVL